VWIDGLVHAVARWGDALAVVGGGGVILLARDS